MVKYVLTMLNIWFTKNMPNCMVNSRLKQNFYLKLSLFFLLISMFINIVCYVSTVVLCNKTF